MRLLSLREHTSSIVVAALSSAFGVALLQLTNNLAVALTRDDEFGQAALLALMLNMLAIVFIAISVYVGAIVTANAFSTIIAGRTRTIALVRLIGGSARSQRRQIAGEGLLVGVVGSLVGAGVGIVAAAGIFQFAQGADALPAINYSYFDLIALAPIVGVIVTTWAAAWAGSSRVLSVTPMQALGASVDSIDDSPTHSIRRIALSTVMVGIGLGLTVVGMLVGLTFAPGVLISLVGGIISFTGFILGAQFVMPQVLRFIGARIGRGAAGTLAAQNSVRYPERSTRITTGLVIGITLVTMLAVATETFRHMLMLSPGFDSADSAAMDASLAAVVGTFSILIGFSAVIAAVGLVNSLSLSIVQRTRELGLLRALGFTAAQVRSMIRLESAQLTIAASVVGLALGTFYGWAGAQSLLGSLSGQPGLVPPMVPWWILVVVAALAAALAFVASISPIRRVIRITPVQALAID